MRRIIGFLMVFLLALTLVYPSGAYAYRNNTGAQQSVYIDLGQTIYADAMGICGDPYSTAPSTFYFYNSSKTQSGSVNIGNANYQSGCIGIGGGSTGRYIEIPLAPGATINTLTLNAYGMVQARVSNFLTYNPMQDHTPPAVPSNLKGSVTASSVSIAWDSVTDSDFSYYNLYKDGLKIKTLTTPSYIDTSVVLGKSNVYQISSVDLAGNESTKSPSLTLAPEPDITLHKGLNSDVIPVSVVNYGDPKSVNTSAILPYKYDNAPNVAVK